MNLRSHKKIFVRTGGIFLILLFSVHPFLFALPQDHEVVAGSAIFDSPDADTLNITAADKTVINFSSFNIAQNETVNFIQPFSSASVLSNVTGPGVSNIFGNLNANGTLILSNPNGLYFAPTANVNVNNFVATSLAVSTNNFLNNNYTFERKASLSPAQIVNSGNIMGNNIALIAGSVHNEGVVVARVGLVHMASGDKATVSIDAQGLINVEINTPTGSPVVDRNGVPVKDAIKNTGSVEGATVLMNAQTVSDIFENAVNQEGVVKATGLIEENGMIKVVSNQNIQVAGTLEAPKAQVIVQSKKSVTVNNDLKTIGPTTIAANDNIKVNANITTDSGNLNLLADDDLNGQGAFLQTPDTTIKTTTFGDITIQSSGESTLANIESSGALYLNKAGTDVTYTQAPGSDITTQGSLYIREGVTLVAPAVIASVVVSLSNQVAKPAYPAGRQSLFSIGQDWTNLGTFIAGTSTVQLIGLKDATVYGDNTFNNFTVIEPGKKVSFEAGKTQEIVGVLTLQGEFGKLLNIQSTSADIPWRINPLGTTTISYVLIQNSENVNIHGPPLTGLHLQNSLGNTGWDFSQSPVVWTNFNNTSLWSDPLNWDGGFIPGIGDSVLLRGDEVAEAISTRSVVDPAFPGFIANLTLDSNYTGTLTLQSDLTVSGNWSNLGGTFNPGISTVIFNDASKVSTILGNNTFYNFTVTTPSKVLVFEAGKTQTILGTWTVQGAYAQHVRLLSSEAGQKWFVDPRGPIDITAAWVEDSTNINTSEIVAHLSTVKRSFAWDPSAIWIGPVGDSNWSTAANWDDGSGGHSVPDGTIDVIFGGILGGATGTDTDSTIDAGFGGTVNSLTINSSYTHTITLSRSLTVNSNIAINGGIFIAGSNTITVGGNWDATGGTFTAGASTVIFDGTVAQSVTSDTEAFNNLEIRNVDAVVTFTDAFTTVNFTIDSDNYAGTVDVDFEEGLTYIITGTLTLNGAAAEVITLDSQDGATQFTLNVQSADQYVDYVTVYRSATISNDIFASFSTDGGGNDSSSASPHWVFSIGNIYIWTGTTDTTWATANNWRIGGVVNGYPDDNTDTAYIDSTAHAITTAAAISIGELITTSGFTGSVTVGDGAGDTFTIDDAGGLTGDFTLVAATFDANDNTLTIDGDTTISGGTLKTGTNTITFGNNSAVDVLTMDGGELQIESDNTAADIVLNLLSWTNNAGTIIYNGSGVNTNLLVSLSPYYNLVINDAGSGSIYTLDGNIQVTNDLTITSGTFDANTRTTTVTGLTTVDGGTYLASTATQTFNGGLTETSGTFTGSTGDVEVNGVFSLSNGTFMAPSAGALFRVSDDFLVSGGSFDANGGRMTLDTTTEATVDAPAGGLTFWDFYITTPGKTIKFNAGDTFNIAAPTTWTVTGAAGPGNLITLTSAGAGQWIVNPNAFNISWVDVSNSNNTSGTVINPTNSNDDGGNTNWFSAYVPPPPTTDTTINQDVLNQTANRVMNIIGQTILPAIESPIISIAWAEEPSGGTGDASPEGSIQQTQMFNYFYNNPNPWAYFGNPNVANKVVSNTSVEEGRVVTYLNYQDENGQWVRKEVYVNAGEQTTVNGLKNPSDPFSNIYYEKDPYSLFGDERLTKRFNSIIKCQKGEPLDVAGFNKKTHVMVPEGKQATINPKGHVVVTE